ncbi:MAG: hypothetical protein ACOCWA_03050 [Bacteroidota bacterium]
MRNHRKSGFFTALIMLISGAGLQAQLENYALGSKQAALANAYSMQSGIWSVHHNQAGLGFFPHFAVGFHHENKYVIPENNLHAVGLTYPVNAGTFGLSYSYFGFSAYNESKIGLAFGKQFGNGFAAGIQLNYHHHYREQDYGNRNTLSIEGGIQYKAGENVAFGAHLFNPTRSKISPYDRDTIPTVFRTGVSITPTDESLLLFQLEKSLNYKMRIQTGIQYLIMESLYLRGGVMTQPFTASFGLGYEIGKLSADVAFSRHRIIGFTPHFSLQFEFR